MGSRGLQYDLALYISNNLLMLLMCQMHKDAISVASVGLAYSEISDIS